MKPTHHKPHPDTSAGAGVMKGALVGMALGAAAVVLSKKENRKKLQTRMNDLLEMGEDRLDQTSEKLQNFQQGAKKRVAKEVERVSNALDDASAKAKRS